MKNKINRIFGVRRDCRGVLRAADGLTRKFEKTNQPFHCFDVFNDLLMDPIGFRKKMMIFDINISGF